MRAQKVTGFTLIEIMIVVVIVAILMGAVVMSFPRDINDILKEQADRFQVLLSLSQDESILQSRELAIGFNQSGYRFFQLDNAGWIPFSDEPFRARKIPAGILTELYLEGLSVRLEDAAETKPQVFILSSGEMTPFSYQFKFPAKSSGIKINVDAVGTIEQEVLQ